MASTEETIDFINFIISVYIGYFIVISGVIGNIINILVFTQLKIFRKNQSAFYLTVTAIVQSNQLIFGSAVRVTTAAFGYDPTRTSLIWCKIRQYLLQFTAVILAIIMCIIAIDQYLATSYYVQLRQLSTLKIAHCLIAIVSLFAALYGIPFAIFTKIHVDAGCATFNLTFNYYYSFIHLCLLLGVIPMIISSLFSLLAYQNVRRIIRRQMPVVRRRLDHQLTAMILVRVAIFVITTTPFVCFRIYEINSPVDENNEFAVAVDRLSSTIITAIFTIQHAGGFYIFSLTSSQFRRQVKCLFHKIIRRKCMRIRMNRNRVTPQTVEESKSSKDGS
ncbi:unnamed protein product [Adineta steineri]|uniref:G-protein coupled receptors family 1 profile domain-containing protein n=1 Tax=Adineta steineri TaxID=433720 RepID=A0A819QS00_9BILA|nr:unnamed protein product [Adineta steineri]CAF1115602.1 unnamed protein product [Adineta steineri]CAF4033102.1 unnamed protein product [Adineta steineri]